MIKLVVETVIEKHQLPEAPISITVEAFFQGFRILITRRSDEQSIIPQVPGIVTLIGKLVESGFEPSRTIYQAGLPSPEGRESGKEKPVPICGTHHTPMVWREGENRQTGKRYAFWACPERNPDGTFCKYKPEKKT